MEIFLSINSLREYIAIQRNNQKKIGFVPTMGALHEGHLSLIKASKAASDITVCSIFVNPIQFNDLEDLKNYPRIPEEDIKKLEKENCDVLFLPEVKEMYPEKPVINFSFGKLEEVMEGKLRKGHFQGVGIVVAKLFNIVQPDFAYFGQKDLQQYTIVNQLIKDLSMNLNVICMPIVREDDGLAMSSRNKNLTPEGRLVSPILYKALSLGKQYLLEGQSIEQVKETINSLIKKDDRIKLEYFEIVDSNTLEDIKDIKGHKKVSLCIAAYVGKVRLIDNVFLFS